MLDDELAHEPAEREPSQLAAVKLEKGPLFRHRLEQLGCTADTDCLEQLGREAVEMRDRTDQSPNVARLLLEHLGGEVSEERASRAAHTLERARAFSSRGRPERFDRQPHCG